MPTSAAHSVLFFRVYKEAALPLYAALVDELCASPHLPFQLATTLEDIGQDFMRLAERINAELARRGLLDLEVDADQTVEALIESLLTQMRTGEQSAAADPAGERIVALRDISVLKHEPVRRALKMALIMTHDLPAAIVARPEPA